MAARAEGAFIRELVARVPSQKHDTNNAAMGLDKWREVPMVGSGAAAALYQLSSVRISPVCLALSESAVALLTAGKDEDASKLLEVMERCLVHFFHSALSSPNKQGEEARPSQSVSTDDGMPHTTVDDQRHNEECCLYEALENLISREKTCPASADFSYIFQHVNHADAGASPLLDSNLVLTLARPLFNMFVLGALEKSNCANPERLVRAAGSVLFQLSICKFDVIYSLIRDAWDNCAKGGSMKSPFYKGTLPNNDEVRWSQMRAVEFLYLNQHRLWRVLELVNSYTTHLKKGAIMVIAGPLRKAVWNYMHLYPADLPAMYDAAKTRNVKDCATGPSPSADGQPPHELFMVARTWPDSMKKRAVVFPLAIVLFVLNPDRHLDADINGCTDEKHATFQYCKLIRKLKKLMKQKSTQDIGLRCLSDLLKAATFLHVFNNPLYALVSDVDSQIKDLLFHRTKEAKGLLFSLGGEHSVEKQDVVVMIDFLVGQFIMRPPLIMRQLFLQCLLPTAPASLKLILIRALLALAEGRYGVNVEEDRELKDAYWYLASPLRMLFQSYVFSNRKLTDKKEKVDKKVKPVDKDIAQAQNETILALIGLYRREPALALASGGHSNAAPQSVTGEEDSVTQLQTLFTSLSMCVWDVSCPDIPPLAAETLLALHEPSMIPLWFPEDPPKGFHQIHSAIDVCFGKILLGQTDNMNADQVMALLDVLVMLIRQSTSYIASLRREGIQDTEDISQLRAHCLEQLESGLLTQLCSWEPELVKRAVMCFGALCDQVDVLGEHDSDWNPIAANYPLYRQLATHGIKVFGRVAQQKIIRNILRAVERETPGNLAAWEEVYRRWRDMTRMHVAPEKEKKGAAPDISPEADNARLVWQNYTGFLCALGGVCLSRSSEGEGERVPGKGRRSAQIMHNITALIKEMLELLMSEDLFVRQTIISAFGSSLCPAIYSTLFSQIQSKVATALGEGHGTVTINDKSSLFVEVAISVVKLILEQPQDSSDNLALANFENLIQTFTRYISLIGKGEDSDRLKCRICILTDVMMSRKKFISFQDETHFRKTMLHYALEWTSEAALRGSSDKKEGETRDSDETSSQSASVSHTHTGKKTMSKNPGDWPTDRESARRAWLGDKDENEEERNLLLDENCMRAVGALLKDFPLQSTELARRNSEEDKSRIFLKLFTYLQSVLKSCWKGSQTTIEDEMKLIHNNTIKALSNLLNANIDAGLEYFIEMGYDEDDELRRSFLTVLTNLISERTNEDFDEDSPEDHENADDGTANLSGGSQRLIQLLLEPDMMLVTALVSVANISDADNLAQQLVRVFLEFGDVQVLLKTTISREVKSTLSAETLFRSNSVASKMMGAYSKHIASEYLKQTLRSSVLEVCGNYAGHEVDPARLAPGEDVQANVARLISTATMFLNAIFQSAPSCPDQIREVCRYLHTCVNDAFPGCGNKSIGGFLFLRYFCPAVVAPDGYGILEQTPSEGARRVLVLVAKMLQNLANGILFGAKEASMPVELNPFISENLQPVENYYACLLAASNIEETIMSPSPTPRHPGEGNRHRNLITENNIETLNRILGSNMNKVRAFVAERSAATDVRGEAGNVIERLESTVVGADSGRGGDSASDQSNILFETFMKQNEKRDVDDIKELGVFFQGPGRSTSNNPVFYYIARRLTPDINKELFLYYILRTLRENFAKGKHYDLVFDSTLFEEENMLEYSWCMKLWKMVPRVLKSNLNAIYIVHANSILKRVSKKIAPFVNWKSMKKFHFISKPSELADYVPDCQEVLPKDVVKTEAEIHSSFPGVTLNSRHEVALHLTPNLLHIVTHRDYMFGIVATMTDFIPISSIQEVTNVDRGRKCDPNEFILRYIVNGVEKSMVFTSALSEPIMGAIRASVVRESQASQLDQMQKATGGRTFRASEVPGTLLNMALLNLGSVSPHTREAANDLLCQLSATFNFSVSLPLMRANGKAIPSNTLPFVNQVSRLIAENEPHFTLEILREWRHAFPKVSPQLQHTCIEYVRPWLEPLRAMCESTDKSEKGKEVLHNLIDMTIAEKKAFNSLLTGLWRHIGKFDTLASMAFDHLIDVAVRDMSNVEDTRLVHEIIVMLNSQNSELLSKKIITRVLDILDDASITFSAMDGPGLWAQLSVLTHCLAELSFSDLHLVETYMGEMIHLILMTFNTGVAKMKNSVYSLTINLLQALCEHNICNEEGWKLESLLTQPKFKLIFLGSGAGLASAASAVSAASMGGGNKRVDTRGGENTIAVEKVASALMTTICGCENRDKWHSTWVKLTRWTALSGPACLRPRAFVTLGVAFRQPLTDELLHDILNGLHAVLPVSLSASDFAVPMSILTCLRHLFANWPRRPEVCGDMFWFAVSLLHVGDEHLFPSTLAMLSSVIKTTNAILSSQRKSGETKLGLGAYLMSCRDRRPELEEVCQRLEGGAGLSFRSSFAFAMVASVLKGLCFPSTRRNTIDLLSLLIDIANTEASDTENWFVSQCESITYTLALMPLYMTTNLVATLPVVQPVQVWVRDRSIGPSIFSHPLFQSSDSVSMLLGSIYIAMAKHIETDVQVTTYRALADAIQLLPGSFQTIYPSLFELLYSVLLKDQTNENVQEAALSLIQVVVSDGGLASIEDQLSDTLQMMGFKSILSLGQMKVTKDEDQTKNANLVKVSCDLMQTVI